MADMSEEELAERKNNISSAFGGLRKELAQKISETKDTKVSDASSQPYNQFNVYRDRRQQNE